MNRNPIEWHQRMTAKAKKDLESYRAFLAEQAKLREEGKSHWEGGAYVGVYVWTYLPSGKEGISKKAFISRREFLDTMAGWNRNIPDTWAYREA